MESYNFLAWLLSLNVLILKLVYLDSSVSLLQSSIPLYGWIYQSVYPFVYRWIWIISGIKLNCMHKTQRIVSECSWFWSSKGHSGTNLWVLCLQFYCTNQSVLPHCVRVSDSTCPHQHLVQSFSINLVISSFFFFFNTVV